MSNKINVLMIDDNQNSVNRVKNYFSKHEVIDLVLTAVNGKEGLDKIINYQNEYDLIIMDLIMPELDGITILEEMKERNIKKHVIILTSYKKEYTVKAVSEYNIDYYMLKPFNMESLEKRILEIMNFKELKTSDRENELRVKISEMLHNLGVPSHIKGYQYIRDGILMMYKEPAMLKGITKEIYPELATRYQTTSSRVERAIRHAIEVSWTRGDYRLMEKYFGNSLDYEKSKPTNAEFIVTLTDRLRLDNKVVMI
ncbi:MAG: sporulation transcription factor Spo0A [Firmicutes bacterium]|nr:sporulation transcription factor Spo0A [Bacillota bacterium]